MAQQRLNNILTHIQQADIQSSTLLQSASCSSTSSSSSSSPSIPSSCAPPSSPSSPLRWNGWGFKDTEFFLDPATGQIALKGNRYLYSGKQLSALRAFMEEKAGLDVNKTSNSQPEPTTLPAAKINQAFLDALPKTLIVDHSVSARLFHSHGHTCQEVYALRFGSFDRVVDLVVFPQNESDVVELVKEANAHNVVLMPYGGGTSVSQALMVPTNENRMVVSVDMHLMCRIKWLNRSSLLACIEAGAVGRQLEQELKAQGYVMGHEPDSMEFSTLGGWVATRASGMRKNKYGNIEDLIVNIRVVLPSGVMQKSVQVPRMSTGPDLHELVLGSEGTFGIVTEVVVKIRPLPACTSYGSMIFPSFEMGVKCLDEVAKAQCAPVSIRLVDNMQFQFGLSLKPPTEDWKTHVLDKIKKWWVLNQLKFEPEQMVAATLLFEGTKQEIAQQEKRVYAIAAKYGGMKAGAENGIRGYFLTYMIAYLRDFGMNFQFIGESFETSVPHEYVLPLCTNVKKCIRDSAKKCGVAREPFVSCRVTQLYDTGVCVYFYFGFVWHGLADPVSVFNQIEHDARDEILRNHGSLSHHHGVGKLRKHWMEQTISNVGMQTLRGIKQAIDPKNIFGNQNLI